MGSNEKQMALVCRGVKKYFGAVKAVDGVDLTVKLGECFGLLGPNGAGKTTLVEAIEGLTRADSGEIIVLGYQWGAGDDRAFRDRIAVQLQETQLADKLTVEETIRLFRSFYPKGRSVEEVIKTVELGEKRKERVHKLSGGTKQRLALACALVSDPELLFLDEPTTGLDPQARFMVWEMVEGFRAKGGTVILTTHYMEEAARLCDRVAIMDHGKVLALGSPASLVESLGGKEIIEFSLKGEIGEEKISGLPGAAKASRKNEGYTIVVKDANATLPALLALVEKEHGSISRLVTRAATLEDVFMAVAGGRLHDE
jgi:ABC-2 type transport system ATP-binding protein